MTIYTSALCALFRYNNKFLHCTSLNALCQNKCKAVLLEIFNSKFMLHALSFFYVVYNEEQALHMLALLFIVAPLHCVALYS